MNIEWKTSRAFRRTIAIALLLVPLALVLVIAAPAIASYQDHRAHVAILARDLAAYRTAIAAMPAERVALTRLQQSPALNEVVLAAPQASDAAAQLQEKLTQVTAGAGARVIDSSTQVMAADGGLTELGMHIVFDADIATATRVLHELEASRPLLIIRRCIIRDVEGETHTPGVPPGPNLLQTELDISAFMRPS